MTTPRTRPLVFAIAYSEDNFGGALADVTMDMLHRFPDTTIVLSNNHKNSDNNNIFVITAIRKFIFVTLLSIIITWLLAIVLLTDQTVIDPDAINDDDLGLGKDIKSSSENNNNSDNNPTMILPYNIVDGHLV